MAFQREKYQYLAVIVGNILVFSQATHNGWFSPSVPYLQSADNSLLDGPMSTEMTGWAGAMQPLGAILGVIAFGSLAMCWGFKRALLLASLPLFAAWLLIIYMAYAWHILMSRFLSGITVGAFYVCMPQFIAEISSDHIRGQLNSYIHTLCNVGILLGFAGGSYIPRDINPWIMLTLPVAFLIGFWFMPETPQQLLRDEKLPEAEQSLRFYRNCKADSTNAEHDREVRDELNKFVAIAKQKQNEPALKFEELLTPVALRALCICPFLMTINQFGGSIALRTYAVTIFAGTRSSVDPDLASIVVAVFQIVGTYGASVLVDRAGRKALLLISTLGGSVMMAITAVYALLVEQEVQVDGWDWLPVVAISAFIVFASIGIWPVPYVMLAEVLPPRIRRIGAMIASCILYAVQSVMLKLLPTLLEQMHLFGCLFLFAAVMMVGFVFTVLVVRETKGMNLDVLREEVETEAEVRRRSAGGPESGKSVAKY